MLGVQLTLGGDRLVMCNGVVVGMLVDEMEDDCLGVLRILSSEYATQIKTIRDGLNDYKNDIGYINSASIVQAELIVSVRRQDDDFRDLCGRFCFPMKVDNLIITYITCKKAYTIKQSAIWVKYELKKLKVIK